ncbi:assimilatory sulfite reductase (NADPH) hemoprotein subunit [Buchnera aphidicola (Kurisakia onigurumii)]|uniref:assimilatory sulfite reductase (NADPH) hemoprotein subunit n=1 Tax=Buchnera aphidicola TaxID=9 RepID=UPI0031B6D7C8
MNNNKNKDSNFIVKGILSDAERIKKNSNYLRGTIQKDLKNNITNGFEGDNFFLIRFHGMYQQDDRDIRQERIYQKLEPRYTMMLRCRIPGGVITTKQWLKIDKFAISNTFYKTIRLTNRQTFQLHGIFKNKLKLTHKMLNSIQLDSLATANDVNRNVVCSSNPYESYLHYESYKWAKKISDHLLPKTHAYSEIWLDKKKIFSNEKEPILSKSYLPRKFKISIVIPPNNDVDIHANDISLITIPDFINKNKILGFNILIGGGLSIEHNNHSTWPAIASEIGFVSIKKILSVVESIVTIQRDWGDRTNRKNAKTRYTIKRVGIDNFKKEIESRSGIILKKNYPYFFLERGDKFGWVKGFNGLWYLTIFVPNGRISQYNHSNIRLGILEIAKAHTGTFRITSSQNLIISGISENNKKKINNIAIKYNLIHNTSLLRQNSMACVSFPTCPLAMAEAERMLDGFIKKLEKIFLKNNLIDEYIVVRITGCPNNCARALLAEIGLIGKSPGKYNLYLGGNRIGTRIPSLYIENCNEKVILEKLSILITLWSIEKKNKEGFGDFVIRKKIVKEITNSSEEFWKK